MKIIHTSDWHLGHSFHGRKRYGEFEKFFEWLEKTVVDKNIDVLLVAGDVFDSSTPSNRTLEMYYRFLHRMSVSETHVVIIAGNHDSPSLLDAPADLLRHMNIHVRGVAAENPENEVIIINDGKGQPALVVCAVPYLRDRDVRRFEAGESPDDRAKKLVEGVREHYRLVCDAAERKRIEIASDIPVIVMGHLFAAGGRMTEGDGVRELYVGSLAHVRADIFPCFIDYLALGHLHLPQKVRHMETGRYSGSPLPMSFGEANHEKSVIMLEFSGRDSVITEINVPRFRQIVSVSGSFSEIESMIKNLETENSDAFVEVVHNNDASTAEIKDFVSGFFEKTGLDIIRITGASASEKVCMASSEDETLENLDEKEVFLRCMADSKIPENRREELFATFVEALKSLSEDDVMKE